VFVLIGSVIVVVSIVLGYTMHGGNLGILFQITEIIIIGGSAVGTLLIANPLPLTMRVIKGALGTMKGSHVNKASYLELLKLFYDLFSLSRREGIIALEAHFEEPQKSAIFAKAPGLLANHHALDFFCDTLRTISMGNVSPYDLEDIMEKDLEAAHHEEMKAPAALSTVGDAFPGLGIVAAVLGVVITMGKIDEPPAVIGHSVAAALVGTFLGILLSYGFVGPVAKNMEHLIEAEGGYLQCIKAGLLAAAKESPPMIVVECARRAIAPEVRPSFKEAEEASKKS
jgi:chemotaxis protein MotA